MALTPYDVARELYASNMTVAEVNARDVEHRLLEDYAAARLEYQVKHQHYTSRGRIGPAAAVIAAAPPVQLVHSDGYTVGDVLEYTEGVQQAHHAVAPAERAAASAGEVPPDASAAPPAAKITHNVSTNTPHLGDRSTPRELVVSYPAFTGHMMPGDPLFRGAVADVQASCALFSVAEMRRAIEDAQRDVIERAMFPCLRRKLVQFEPSRELALKDAQPLWERVQILRQETESEEEMTFRNLQLGYEVQRDLIQRGILCLNPENKLLMVGPVSPAPAMYADAIIFAFRAERLALESMEESERMNIIDDAWAVKTHVLAVFFDMAPVSAA